MLKNLEACKKADMRARLHTQAMVGLDAGLLF
jgi:hypothetical protein